MQLAVKGCNTPHPKGSWSHNFPSLSIGGTPHGPTHRSSFPSQFWLELLSPEPSICLEPPVVRCRWQRLAGSLQHRGEAPGAAVTAAAVSSELDGPRNPCCQRWLPSLLLLAVAHGQIQQLWLQLERTEAETEQQHAHAQHEAAQAADVSVDRCSALSEAHAVKIQLRDTRLALVTEQLEQCREQAARASVRAHANSEQSAHEQVQLLEAYQAKLESAWQTEMKLRDELEAATAECVLLRTQRAENLNGQDRAVELDSELTQLKIDLEAATSMGSGEQARRAELEGMLDKQKRESREELGRLEIQLQASSRANISLKKLELDRVDQGEARANALQSELMALKADAEVALLSAPSQQQQISSLRTQLTVCQAALEAEAIEVSKLRATTTQNEEFYNQQKEEAMRLIDVPGDALQAIYTRVATRALGFL